MSAAEEDCVETFDLGQISELESFLFLEKYFVERSSKS